MRAWAQGGTERLPLTEPVCVMLTACVCLGRGWRMGRRLSNTGLSGTLPEGVGGLTSLQDMCVLGGGELRGEARRGGGGH